MLLNKCIDFWSSFLHIPKKPNITKTQVEINDWKSNSKTIWSNACFDYICVNFIGTLKVGVPSSFTSKRSWSTKYEHFYRYFQSTVSITMRTATFTLRKIPKFHLVSWCRNFVDMHNFGRVSKKFAHRDIRWNYGNLCSFKYTHLLLFSNTQHCTRN